MERLEIILGWKYRIIKNTALMCVICAIVNILVSFLGQNLGTLVFTGELSIFLVMNTVVVSTSEKGFDGAFLDSLLSFYPFDKKEYLPYYAKKIAVFGMIMVALVMTAALISERYSGKEIITLAILLVFTFFYIMLCAVLGMRATVSKEIDIIGFYGFQILLLIFYIAVTLFLIAFLL